MNWKLRRGGLRCGWKLIGIRGKVFQNLEKNVKLEELEVENLEIKDISIGKQKNLMFIFLFYV